MKLSHEEEIFLRHWIYDEVHFHEGTGPAKRLQLVYKVSPANLALIIAAALTEPGEQEAAADGPPPMESPVWVRLISRLAEGFPVCSRLSFSTAISGASASTNLATPKSRILASPRFVIKMFAKTAPKLANLKYI